MKVAVKTLKGAQFSIEVNPSDSVISVKKQIEELKGRDVYPYEQIVLIHVGKILSDDTTLSDNKVSENGFLVIMINKKTQVSAPAARPTEATPSAVAPVAAPAPSFVQPAPPIVSNPPTTENSTVPQFPAVATQSAAVPQPLAEETRQNPTDAYGSVASSLVTGSVREGIVDEILAMGGGQWDKATVARALSAAFNNPERAVEYLYSGIPVSAAAPEPAAPTPSPTAPAAATDAGTVRAPAEPLNLFPQAPAANAAATGGDAGTGALDFLRTNPQFIGLRNVVQTSPQLLPPMLQELGRQNPELYQLVSRHPEEFMRLLAETEGGAEEGLGGAGLAAPQTLQVTQEEAEAIGRLEALGFEKSLVIEAYFACDKNEDLAANYLFDHASEFQD